MNLTRTLALAAACLLPHFAVAASPIDGSWKGSFKARDGSGEYVLTFAFKADGDKVTGSVTGNNKPAPIVSGLIKGNDLEFKVDVNGTIVDHQCTVSGDTIDMVFAFGNQPPAKMTLRRVAAAAPDPSGLWKWTVAPQGSGQVFAISARLSLADGKLTGTYQSQMGEAPISDASYTDGAIAFSVVRERDGKQFTVKYRGVLSGDTITGTLELPGFDGGDSATLDWKASRTR
jgi:hypothetical protein